MHVQFHEQYGILWVKDGVRQRRIIGLDHAAKNVERRGGSEPYSIGDPPTCKSMEIAARTGARS